MLPRDTDLDCLPRGLVRFFRMFDKQRALAFMAATTFRSESMRRLPSSNCVYIRSCGAVPRLSVILESIDASA
jgi:hypothetical protein